MLKIRCIRDGGAFCELEPKWNPLLQTSRSNSFFLTHEWLSTWWRHYHSDYLMQVLVAEDGDETVGLAPLMIGGGIDHLGGSLRALSRQIRFLKFLSQGEVFPEHMDFVCQLGREEEITAAFVQYLAAEARASWDVLCLAGQPVDSPNRQPLLRALSARGLRPDPGPPLASPYLTLPGSTDEFWQRRSASFKKSWRYYHRALAKQGSVRFQLPDERWSIDRLFDELVRLNKARFGERNQSFVDQRFTEFHRSLCHVLQPKGWLLLCVLTLDDEAIAARYDFVYAGKVWSYQGGWSEALADFRIGSTFLGYVMEHCIELGLGEYDFLAGDEEYKLRWSDGKRELSNIQASNPSAPRGWLYWVTHRAHALLKNQVLPRLPRRVLPQRTR